MKTDQLNLGQLMRYGFCGFFLCLAFVYGRGGPDELNALFSKKENNEALLAATFFASGAVFYSLYRAIVYPLLGRAAIFAVYQIDDALWVRNRSDRQLREPRLGGLTAQFLLLLLPVALTALLVFTFPRAACFSICFQGITFFGGVALATVCLIMLILTLLSSGTPQWLKYYSKVSLIWTPKKELQLDIERWESKQREQGAQHLDEWATQIHLLYTTSLSLGLGSFAGVLWECIQQNAWTEMVQCSMLGVLVIYILLLAAFASDCRRRHLEEHLRRYPLRVRGKPQK